MIEANFAQRRREQNLLVLRREAFPPRAHTERALGTDNK